MLFPITIMIALIALIWYLGGGQFGRQQTQGWIDRLRRYPRLHAFLNRHHGKFRALPHYLEFGGLFLALYYFYDSTLGSREWRFDVLPAAVIALVAAAGAYLDEMHQLKSGTRQFRREDFLHSCCGIAIAAAAVFYQSLLRGL